MANLKHMDIIKRGVNSWNTWRANNSHVLPSLSDAGLHMAYLNKANLSKADLSDAGLRLAELIEANLSGADLCWANLSEANLREANLMGANLQGVNLSGGNLRNARLKLTNLDQANISRADLNSAELYRANLSGADLNEADLSGATLRDANLIGANLTGANLDGADFTNAVVGATLFGNVDLSNAKGLESLQHLGPSTVGVDTIYKSRGKVPVVFLRNAGVPHHLIDYIELFVDEKEKYFSCFISYSPADEEFAHKLYADLQAHGVRCWLATEKLMKRDRKHAIVGNGVNLHDKVILVLSENSIEKDWVENDYYKGFEKEIKSGKTVVMPISLDDSLKYSEIPWIVKMRRIRYSSDFSLWQDSDSYQEVLSYLLEDLQDESSSYDEFDEDEYRDMEEEFSRWNETEVQ